MWKPWGNKQELKPRNEAISINDPAMFQLLGWAQPNFSGSTVTEVSALGLSAVYRAIALISGTVAQLPIRSMWMKPDGTTQRMQSSIYDVPDGPDGLTKFEWVETILCHLLLHGNAYLRIIRNQAGGIYALNPVHPLLVQTMWPCPDEHENGEPSPVGGKWFWVSDIYGHRERFDATGVLQIMSISLNGLIGVSPIYIARNSLGTAISGDRAAAKLFGSGALMGGMVSPEEEMEGDEAKELKTKILEATSGWENAGGLVVTNKKFTVSPWTMTMQDAQFLQSRQFSVEEVARWFGVPPHLLMQTEKQTSWGTGVAEQNRGLGRFTLAPWTTRVEQRLSRLLPQNRWAEFDYAGLERPNFETMVGLVIQQMTSDPPLISQGEARALLNLGPMPTEGDPNANP